MNETEVAQLDFTCEAGCSKSQWQDKACNMRDTSMRLMSFSWKQCVPCAVQQATCWRPASTWMKPFGRLCADCSCQPLGTCSRLQYAVQLFRKFAADGSDSGQ